MFSTEESRSLFLKDKMFICVRNIDKHEIKGKPCVIKNLGDNNFSISYEFNKSFEVKMSDLQLLEHFVPDYVEKSTQAALVYGYWLSSRGFPHELLSPMLTYYNPEPKLLK